jgi:DNA-binding NtrC family response regulator
MVIGQTWDSRLPFESEAMRQLRQQLRQLTDARQHLRLIWHDPAGRRLWMTVEVRDDPRDPQRRILYLHDQTELHRLRAQLEQVRYGEMIGDSPPMRELYTVLQRIAQSECTVLIEGETGVGKELAAHAIHTRSQRCDGPFVAINCACINETLLSSQLFGHRQGAFTGATTDQQGLFEAADGGTLFLDEIGDISPSVQAGLLRVLEERKITRLGDTQARPVNVRVLAATHKDLATEMSLGHFRQDLFYRLRVGRVRAPALRERAEDIPTLVDFFLKNNSVCPHQSPEFSVAAMQCLLDYAWPGNVRELRNLIDYVLIHCDEPVIQPHHLPSELHASSPTIVVAAASPAEAESDRRTQLLTVLQQAGGNRRRAAQLLGVSRSTLYRWLDEINMSHKKVS